MKNRGFTLVELLGVIIVLGLLGTISTIVIMDNIETAKRKSVINSAEQIIKAVTIDYTTNDNFTTDKIDILTLNLGGAKPESGYIQFDENEKVRLYMLKDGYCVAKTYETELEATKEGDFEVCDWYTSSKIDRIESSSSVLTLDDLKEGNLLSYKIYGNSYQETRSGKNLIKPQDIYSSNEYYSEQILDGRNTIKYVDHLPIKYTGYKFKENTQYTVSADVKTTVRQTANEQQSAWFVFHYTDGTYTYAIANRDSDWTHRTQTSAAGKTVQSVGLLSYNWTNWIYVDVDTFQIEEGVTATTYEPYGAMPSPDYPSEVLGVGDLVTNTSDKNYGKYEIPIKVIGKNLFSTSALIDSQTVKVLDENTNEFIFTGRPGQATTYIYAKPKTQYHVSYKVKASKAQTVHFSVYYTDGSNTNVSCTGVVGEYVYVTGTTRSDKTVSYIKFGGAGGLETGTSFKEIQIEEVEATEYEPYKEEVYSVYLNEPLRCVNGTCDELNFETGQLTRRIKKTVLDGNGTYYNADNNLSKTYRVSKKFDDASGTNPVLCNKLTPIYSGTSNNDTENIQFSVKTIYIRIKRERLNSADVNSVKQFLASNNITFYYLLATPEYETVSLPKIKTYEGTNNIVVTDGNLNASKIEAVVLKK